MFKSDFKLETDNDIKGYVKNVVKNVVKDDFEEDQTLKVLFSGQGLLLF